jgi:hypothetical protein
MPPKASTVAAAIFLAAFLVAPTANAGPPFVTDDPAPVDYQHWQIYGFSTGTLANGAADGAAPGIDVEYGALPNLEIDVAAPLAFSATSGARPEFGYGDTEFAAKYRLFDPGKDDWWPAVAIAPAIDVPTGNAARGLGTGAVHAFLPVWLEKDFGPWSLYGGGGYWINPGAGNKNYWLFGSALQYQVTDALALGGEVFHETASASIAAGASGSSLGTRDSTGFNLGAVYDLTKNYHLLVSAGRGLENAAVTNGFSYYVAFLWSF